MPATRITVAASVLIACLTAPTRAQVSVEGQDNLIAQRLLERSAQSLARQQLGLALLQYSQAERLDTTLAQRSPVRSQLHDRLAQEAAVMQAGQAAAQRLDHESVQRALTSLRQMDVHSSAAVELTLQANAWMADRGGIAPRIRVLP